MKRGSDVYAILAQLGEKMMLIARQVEWAHITVSGFHRDHARRRVIGGTDASATTAAVHQRQAARFRSKAPDQRPTLITIDANGDTILILGDPNAKDAGDGRIIAIDFGGDRLDQAARVCVSSLATTVKPGRITFAQSFTKESIALRNSR
jgi:hypothetical protein